jgi:antitoxin HicB
MKHFKFSVDILPEEDGKGYYAIVPALPGCFSQGKTVEKTKKNIQEAIQLHIRALKKTGGKIPQEDHSFHTLIEVAA